MTDCQPPRGILWDMDGVLVNNARSHYDAWAQVLAPYRLPFTYEYFAETFGQNNRAILSLWFEGRLSEAEMVTLAGQKEAIFRQIVARGITPLPGAAEWLARFRQRGCRQAVASSAPPENIDAQVDGLGFRQFFAALVSGADIPGKPNPDVFLLAAERIGVPPARCLVIEDAPAGTEGAHRAGMKALALATTHPASELTTADLVLPDLSRLTEAMVDELLGKAVSG